MQDPRPLQPTANKLHQEVVDYLGTQISQIDKQKKIENIDFRLAVRKAIEHENYDLVMSLLAQSIDNRQQIKWHVCPIFNQHETLIRDGRLCTPPDGFNPESYIMMATNYVRGALDLLHTASNRINRHEIQRQVKYAIQDALYTFNLIVRNLPEPSKTMEWLEHFDGFLITQLAYAIDITLDQAEQRLTLAKEFSQLKNPSRNLVTLFDIEKADGTVVTGFECDLALSELTPNLLDEYQNRQKKIWYQSLENWQQRLVDLYTDTIKTGKHVIPTQLRTILPGLRNAGLSITGVLEKDIKILNSNFHSGTLVFLGTQKNVDEVKRINLLNGEQLKTYTKAGKILALTTNTDINPTGNDKAIVKNTKFIMQNMQGGLHTNLPFNFARRLSTNDYSGIKGLLEEIATTFIPSLQNLYLDCSPMEARTEFFKEILNYLTNKIQLKEEDILRCTLILESVKKTIQKHSKESAGQIEKLSKIIELSLIICLSINNHWDFKDADNSNLRIACYVNILIFELGYFKDIAINSSCESGKDRTGILLYRTAAISINQYVYDSYVLSKLPADIKERVAKNCINIAKAGHERFKPGIDSGTFGVKEDSRGAMPQTEFPKEVADYLIRKTASFNKHLPVNNTYKRFYFPIGDQDIRIQKRNLLHTLNVLEHQCSVKAEINGAVGETSLNGFNSASSQANAGQPAKPIAQNSTSFWSRISSYAGYSPQNDVAKIQKETYEFLRQEIPIRQTFTELHALFELSTNHIKTKMPGNVLAQCFEEITANLKMLAQNEPKPQVIASPKP